MTDTMPAEVRRLMTEAAAIYQLEGQVMGPGDSLHFASDTVGSSVVVVASGVEIY